MTKPLAFIHTAKPDRSEISQFNKSASVGFLEWFDATLARDKRRFPKGCGFAWFLLEQMLQAYLEKHADGWQQEGRGSRLTNSNTAQGRLVLALIDDETRQQRLHALPEPLWERILAYREKQQPESSVFETIETLLSKGCEAP